MPGVDGIELCRRIRLTPELKRLYILLLTSRTGIDSLVTGLEAGADDYVTKPFEPAELRARIRVGERLINLQNELAERVDQLEAALHQVRQLRGLLPICAYCKKIRDDGNYWHQVEGYLEKHSELQFSHGVCPDCIAKLEAELDSMPDPARND
jgi:response regulator RpfG family c-di-GMP phosphodiesterase